MCAGIGAELKKYTQMAMFCALPQSSQIKFTHNLIHSTIMMTVYDYEVSFIARHYTKYFMHILSFNSHSFHSLYLIKKILLLHLTWENYSSWRWNLNQDMPDSKFWVLNPLCYVVLSPNAKKKSSIKFAFLLKLHYELPQKSNLIRNIL